MFFPINLIHIAQKRFAICSQSTENFTHILLHNEKTMSVYYTLCFLSAAAMMIAF
ncbi:hypothetical protein CAG54_06015, partial [Vibrio sp. V27_P1S3P104]|nr:hypothetical protein [Vibrio sp. V27_P1S3P104]